MGTPYRECPNCGAHLDAGEPCDCAQKERDPRPAAEPEKPLQRMHLMVVCREVNKESYQTRFKRNSPSGLFTGGHT